MCRFHNLAAACALAFVTAVAVPQTALLAQPIMCVTLPNPSFTEVVPISLGIALSERWARGEWTYSDVEQEALHKALHALRSALPSLATPKAPTTSSRFTLLDSAAGLFTPLTLPRYQVTVHKGGRVGLAQRFAVDGATAAESVEDVTADFAGKVVANDLASVIEAFRADSVRVTLFMVAARAGASREVTWIETPFQDATLPVYRGTALSMIPPAGGPRYPTLPTGGRAWGKAHASFIVSANGEIERRSMVVTEASEPQFGDALLAWLPSVRFKPATIEGCPVRALAGLPIEFVAARRR